MTLSERFGDPLFRLGLMLTVVPFAVLAVPAEWANRSRSAGWEQNSSWQRPSSVPAPGLQQAQQVTPVQLSGQAPNTLGQSPRQAPTGDPPSRPQAVARSATPQEVYAAWLVAHPVVRDADLTTCGTAEGQVPQRVCVALRTQSVSDLRDTGPPMVRHRPGQDWWGYVFVTPLI